MSFYATHDVANQRMEERLMPGSGEKMNGGGQIKTPTMFPAKKTTLEKALAQRRLLGAVNHGWKPTGGRPSKIKAFK